MRIKVLLLQQLRKAMRLPWYGGRTPGHGKVLSMTEKALEIATGAITVLEAVPREDAAGQVLLDGMLDGLAVGRHICARYLRHAQMMGPDVMMDPKMERLASDTAGWMCRLGAKVMEEAFRRRRDDTVGKLLEQLRVADDMGEKPGEKPVPKKK